MRHPTLTDLAEIYIAERYRRGDFGAGTLPGVRWHLRSFCRYAGPITPSMVGPALVDGWLSSAYLAKATIRHRLSWFRGWVRWMIRHGHMVSDPTMDLRAPKMPRPAVRTLPAADIGRLLGSTADPRLRLIVLFMAQEGLRAVEVARAMTGDVDWDERIIDVRGKGGERRLLPISDETWMALVRYTGRRVTAGPLVRSRSRRADGISAGHIVTTVSRAMAAAGVAGTGHGLRHSMAAHVLRGGRADLRDVQLALGHRSLMTTAVYLPHSDVERLRDVLAGRWYGESGGVELAC